MESLNCWISPEGKIFKCSYCEHETTAAKILKNLGSEYSSRSSTTQLERLGWLHVSDNHTFIYSDANDLSKCTQAQIDTLFDNVQGTYYENHIMNLINKNAEMPALAFV